MSLANELKDFLSAYEAMTEIGGRKSDRALKERVAESDMDYNQAMLELRQQGQAFDQQMAEKQLALARANAGRGGGSGNALGWANLAQRQSQFEQEMALKQAAYDRENTVAGYDAAAAGGSIPGGGAGWDDFGGGGGGSPSGGAIPSGDFLSTGSNLGYAMGTPAPAQITGNYAEGGLVDQPYNRAMPTNDLMGGPPSPSSAQWALDYLLEGRGAENSSAIPQLVETVRRNGTPEQIEKLSRLNASPADRSMGGNSPMADPGGPVGPGAPREGTAPAMPAPSAPTAPRQPSALPGAEPMEPRPANPDPWTMSSDTVMSGTPLGYSGQGGTPQGNTGSSAPKIVVNRAAEAADTAIRSFSRDVGSTPTAIGEGSEGSGMDIGSNQGAFTTKEYQQLVEKIDPDGAIPPHLQSAATLAEAYNHFMSKGETEKAENIAKRILLTQKQMSQTMGTLALDAIEAGDTESATKLLGDAVARFPSSHTIEFVEDPQVGVLYQVRDGDEVVDQGEMNTQQLWEIATGVSDGSMFLNEVSQFAASRQAERDAPQQALNTANDLYVEYTDIRNQLLDMGEPRRGQMDEYDALRARAEELQTQYRAAVDQATALGTGMDKVEARNEFASDNSLGPDPRMPVVGDVVDGFRYLGGNKNDPSSWEQAN